MGRRTIRSGTDTPDAGVPTPVSVDPHRGFVFPNRMREQRRRRGYPKLLRLAAELPDIPYIRLSKIERGEVVPRPDELRRIAAALEIPAETLLIDIDAPGFDMARWAEPFLEGSSFDEDEERFAALLAAAMRARRANDPSLTIARLDQEFGLPPVNLSRLENAQKTFDRWNAAIRAAVLRIFAVGSEAGLRETVQAQYAAGALNAHLGAIGNAEARRDRTRARIHDIAAALGAPIAADMTPPRPAPTASHAPAPGLPAPAPAAAPLAARLVPVRGAPLAQGLIADVETDATAEAPRAAGPRTFGLRVCRATLGGGLPSQATVLVDPDRFPAPGGLAALREPGGWRLLAVAIGREGRLTGYSINPDFETALDECDPATVAAVVSASFI